LGKVGVLGAEAVRGATDREALRVALLRFFQPIAPRSEARGSAPPRIAAPVADDR